MLKGQLMFAHLRQDRANVQMDVARVRDLEALIDSLLAEVQVVILDLKSLLEVGERAAQLLGSAEYACKIVVSHCAVTVALLCKANCLVQELERDLEIFLL